MKMLVAFLFSLIFAYEISAEETFSFWKIYGGKAGPTGWRCHVVQPDPEDHGPDGINIHDWDGDGDPDLFVNFEEGGYSRLYFNPGEKKVRKAWLDFIEFNHSKCEDSGIGDLDADGDTDYVANGGWVYFNPGKSKVRDSSAWIKMTLFDYERRVPTVTDVDGDGLNDLVVGAQEWYKQPKIRKHQARSWKKFIIGNNRWPMNCIMYDLDYDGDKDMIVADRGREICWYVNPGKNKVTSMWERKTLHAHHEPMFMTIADVNSDQLEDVVITGGSKGNLAEKLIVLLRLNNSGEPIFQEIIIDQPTGIFPKGVAVFDLDGDPKKKEILVIPKSGELWTTTYQNGSDQSQNWQTMPLVIPGAETRKKMDNAWLGDLDSDGDLDVITTEENGGWGVIWFENPLIDSDKIHRNPSK
ncbi:MAG: VCBS repeat-containing protein [Verrucomicrobiota bacterium]|nr:VCBS repeat-containing protein [Verrucomicrobiota bacterium]